MVKSSNLIRVTAAILEKDGKILIAKRKTGDELFAGLWEFPGGKRKKNELPNDCLRREIREELGVNILIREKLMTLKHSYTQFHVTLHVFRCRLPAGRIRAKCAEVRPRERGRHAAKLHDPHVRQRRRSWRCTFERSGSHLSPPTCGACVPCPGFSARWRPAAPSTRGL